MREQQHTVAASAMVDAGFGVWSGWWDMVAAVVAPVFAQARSRFVALDYIRGLLAVAERRSCWQLAELAGHATPGRMQALLGALYRARTRRTGCDLGLLPGYCMIGSWWFACCI